MIDMKSGYWMSSALATNVILGWIPDFLMVYEDLQGAVAPTLYIWSKQIADLGGTGQYGFQDASTGDWVACADANNGIIELTPSGLYTNVESPIPGAGKRARPIQMWATGITPVARANANTGTMLYPTTRNGYVYECIGLTGIIAGAEPTWPTTPGAIVNDADSNAWVCRHEEMVRGGGYGFTIGATIQTNQHYCHFIAFKDDRAKYFGDAANGDIRVDKVI